MHTPIIQSVMVNYDQPLVDNDGTLIENKSSFRVYYYGKLIMYYYPYKFDSSIDGRVIIQNERRQNYFVFHQDSLIGYDYDPYFRLDNRKVDVAKMVKMISLESNRLDTMATLKPDSINSNKSNGTMEEIYNNVEKGGDMGNYITHLYYSNKLKDIKESFSKKLDSIKQMKLYMIRILFPEMVSEKYKITFPKREMIFEMKEVPVEDDKVLYYFNRYKKEHLNQ